MRNIKTTKLKTIYNIFKSIDQKIDYTYENSFFLIKILPFILIILLLIVGFYYNFKNYLLLEKYKDLWQVSQQVLKYDLLNNASLTKYVWKWVNIWDYVPTTQVFESQYFFWTATLTKDAWENLILLASWFYEKFSTPLKIVSSYRSYNYQQNLIKRNPNSVEEWFRANPWESEHQLGLAVDIFETTTQDRFFENEKLSSYRIWLQNNAHKYGYTQSYKFWVNIDWYNPEPWHRRYVWVDLATELYKKNITFSQYYKIFY